MKNIILTLLLVVVSFGALKAQCQTGFVYLTSQADVENFAATNKDCPVFMGYINIGGRLVTSLEPLWFLEGVTNRLRIYDTNITNLKGLSGLKSLGSIYIDNNPNLTSLEGLSDNLVIETTSQLLSNSQLTTCGVRGLCNAIANGSGVIIYSNNAGCNSNAEVLAACAALPVTLTRFEAIAEQSITLLEWHTTAEVESDYFEVETSTDGNDWRSIGQVKASNTTQELSTYSFHDRSPEQGENYYRLKMVDRDGTFSYSIMRSVYLQTLDAYVYPNPVAERIYLKNEALGQVLNLKLFDMQGKPVLVQETGLREGISLEWVDAGVYVCVVNKKGGLSHSFRIVKK